MEVDIESITDTMLSNDCFGAVYSFDTETCGLVTSYQWDFGDGGTSTLKSPTHNYTASGNYMVELIVTNDSTCSPWNMDTLTKIINVNVNQGFNLTLGPDTSLCAGQSLLLDVALPNAIYYMAE